MNRPHNSTTDPLTLSTREMLRQAFQQYEENPDTVVQVADQILWAATQAPRLNFTPTSSGRLAIAIGGEEAFEVRLPYESISSFRTLLARFGVICGAVAQKRSVTGMVRASLKRAGVIADKAVTEQKGGKIEYQGAVVRAQPGSPCYKVDADLDIKQSNGIAISLHLVMQNELQNLFLFIEPRKAMSES